MKIKQGRCIPEQDNQLISAKCLRQFPNKTFCQLVTVLYFSYYERSVNGKLESNSSHVVELKFRIVLFKDAILGFTDATIISLFLLSCSRTRELNKICIL